MALTFDIHNGSCSDLVNCIYHICAWPLSSFCGCTGQFVSYLVTNPEDRFSRDVAHIIKMSDDGNTFFL